MPVRFARRHGKCGRHCKQTGAIVNQAPKELRKTQVVADGQSESASRRIDGDDIVARIHRIAFAVGLAFLDKVHVEQMNLSVDDLLMAFVIKDRTRAIHAFVFDLRRDKRHAAGNDPELVFGSNLLQKVLDRSVARLFSMLCLIATPRRHQSEVFRERCKAAAIGGSFGTLSEIAYALKRLKPVIGLNTWELEASGGYAVTVDESVLVEAGEFAVLGPGNVSTNGGVEVVWSYSSTEFALLHAGSTVTLTYDGRQIQKLTYYGGMVPPKGYSLQRDGSIDSWSSMKIDEWCTASSAWSSADFGTPGGVNDGCSE